MPFTTYSAWVKSRRYVGYASDGYRTEDAFRLISESGINVVNGFGYSEDTDEEVKTVLDCCQKYGLKYLYSSLSIEESIKSYKENPEAELISSAMEQIDKFAGHPGIRGTAFYRRAFRELFRYVKGVYHRV